MKTLMMQYNELKAMMDPFVHMHKETILQESLPGLSDTLVVLTPTDLQKKLLERIFDNVFEKVHLVSLISAHPSLVAEHKEFSDHKSMLEVLKMSLEAGVKTQFVIELVRLSEAWGEKVLIFRLSKATGVDLSPLKLCDEVGERWSHWILGNHHKYGRPIFERKCRVVQQSLEEGTMEIEKYHKQTKKDQISELVFSSPNGHKYDKSEISNDKILEVIVKHKKMHHIFEKGDIDVFATDSLMSFCSLLIDLKKGVCKDRIPVAG
ncbi:hypothetical protein M9H77_25332 [Catharanthus roseus]|uniref:Uncharacterized protein n=1 Tax=Catharanthus roseus TaxID=4058 RepID=A0ACC0A7E3_CATRO|nr:hypothetical protein M9H77_25332 [Catharanthus roseus]